VFFRDPCETMRNLTSPITEMCQKSHVLAGITVAIWIISNNCLRTGAMIVKEMTPDDCFELLKQTGFGRLGCSPKLSARVITFRHVFQISLMRYPF
jgi:hypothetical protein